MVDTIKTYSLKAIEADDYSRDTLTEKQKLRQLLAMGYDVEDPDVEATVTEVCGDV